MKTQKQFKSSTFQFTLAFLAIFFVLGGMTYLQIDEFSQRNEQEVTSALKSSVTAFQSQVSARLLSTKAQIESQVRQQLTRTEVSDRKTLKALDHLMEASDFEVLGVVDSASERFLFSKANRRLNDFWTDFQQARVKDLVLNEMTTGFDVRDIEVEGLGKYWLLAFRAQYDDGNKVIFAVVDQSYTADWVSQENWLLLTPSGLIFSNSVAAYIGGRGPQQIPIVDGKVRISEANAEVNALVPGTSLVASVTQPVVKQAYSLYWMLSLFASIGLAFMFMGWAPEIRIRREHKVRKVVNNDTGKATLAALQERAFAGKISGLALWQQKQMKKAYDQFIDIKSRNMDQSLESAMVAFQRELGHSLSRLERFEPPQPQEFSVGEAIDEVVSQVRRPFFKRGVDIELEMAANMNLVGQKESFQQALTLLLENSFESITESADSGVIKVVARLQGELLELRVRDTGKGFSNNILGQAAQVFATTKQGTHYGLGLSSAIQLLSDFSAKVRLRNTEEGDAEVHVQLELRAIEKLAPEAQLPELDFHEDEKSKAKISHTEVYTQASDEDWEVFGKDLLVTGSEDVEMPAPPLPFEDTENTEITDIAALADVDDIDEFEAIEIRAPKYEGQP